MLHSTAHGHRNFAHNATSKTAPQRTTEVRRKTNKATPCVPWLSTRARATLNAASYLVITRVNASSAGGRDYPSNKQERREETILVEVDTQVEVETGDMQMPLPLNWKGKGGNAGGGGKEIAAAESTPMPESMEA